jgi:hypothetical protein
VFRGANVEARCATTEQQCDNKRRGHTHWQVRNRRDSLMN